MILLILRTQWKHRKTKEETQKDKRRNIERQKKKHRKTKGETKKDKRKNIKQRRLKETN